MMRFLFRWLPLLLSVGLLLSACGPVTMDERLATGGLASVEELAAAARGIPGADVVADEGFRLLFPPGTLFGREALIPTLEAPDSTVALADFLRRFSPHDWQVTVRAGTERGDDYAKALAERRSAQLKLLLEQQGFNAAQLAWSTETGSGAPVEIRAGKVRRRLPKTNPGE